MAIPTYRLPPEVETGMRGRPMYQNYIQESISGTEKRIRGWAQCRGEWDISYPIGDTTESTGAFRAVLAMVRAHEDLYPFPFKDWADYQLTDEDIGTGDGSDTTFQIIKTYDPSQIILGVAGSLKFERDIYLPRSGLVVKVDGVTQTLTTDYTIGSTGIITFTSAPPNGDAITVTGEFDVPVRFNGPPDIVIDEAHLGRINSLPIREVIGTAELSL